MRKTNIFIVLLFAVAIFPGCGKQQNPFGTVYLEGTVTLDGTPIEGVSVTLIPLDTGEQLSAGGKTDASGKFTVTAGGSPAGSGARPGTYDVTFTKMSIQRTASYEESKALYGSGQPPITHLIPQKYNSPKTSGIASITVDKDKRKNKFTFELTSKE